MVALLDALGRHRGLLVVCYLTLLAVYCWLFGNLWFMGAPVGLTYIFPSQGAFEFEWEFEWRHLIGFLVALLVLQTIFLWGGGRVTLARKPAGKWRLLATVLIASLLLAVLLLGMAFALLERVDRTSTETESIRADSLVSEDAGERIFGSLVFVFGEEEIERHYLLGLLVAWSGFLVVGLVALRGVDRETAVTRLTIALLAGSWLEFMVALPVDIAARRRAEECPCATGSWVALALAIPVMLFAFGPAIYLLYLRERRLGRKERHRSRRILLRKSRKASGPS